MAYRVTIQYGQGRENDLERFNKEGDAREFIKNKLAEPSLIKNVIYRLYEFDEIIEAFDAEQIAAAEPTESSSAGRGQGSGFQPNPFANAPRPPGVPHNWNKDKEPDDKEKK